MKKIIFEDISKFRYLLSDKEFREYRMTKRIFFCIPIIMIIPMIFMKTYNYIFAIPIFMLIMSKVPFFLLKFRHFQRCNEVVLAIPLWINTICALLEKNTIHNAIIASLSNHTPEVIQHDLEIFIEKIKKDPEDKNAYLNFLKKYEIDGFQEIMLKLFEFRSLSKEKLKEEFNFLENSLEKFNTMKREKNFKSELMMNDIIIASGLLSIPCVYMLMVSMMPEIYNSFM